MISVTLALSVIDIAHLRAMHSRKKSFILFIKLRFSEKATQFEKKIFLMLSTSCVSHTKIEFLSSVLIFSFVL
jgi:hypothetical protein